MNSCSKFEQEEESTPYGDFRLVEDTHHRGDQSVADGAVRLCSMCAILLVILGKYVYYTVYDGRCGTDADHNTRGQGKGTGEDTQEARREMRKAQYARERWRAGRAG